MGFEAVEKSIPAFVRMFDRAHKKLCEGTLFSKDPILADRRFPARPVGGAQLLPGEAYVGQLFGSELCVIQAGEVIAKIDLPVEELNRVRNEGCGCALVHVQNEVGPISGVADVVIR